MKNTLRLTLISVSLVACSYAAPFMAIGDGAELFITGSLGVRADDNIFLAKNDESDLIFDVNPAIDLTFGKNAQIKGSLTLGLSFANYSDNSQLNTQLLSTSFVTRYDDGKMKLSFNLGYNELNQNSVDIRGLTRRNVLGIGVSAELELSQITSVGGGLSFNHELYKRVGYADSESFTVPLNFYYKWTPKLDLSVGYQYRDYLIDIGSDSSDHFFNVGARGEFSPKLSGNFRVGLNTRKLDQGGDDTQLGLDASFSYEISVKTSLQLGASNDFGTTPQGQQQKNFTMNAMLSNKVNEEWSVRGGVSWRSIDYGTRTDGYFESQLGAAYIVNSAISISGSYVYRTYSSDLKGSEFENHVFSVSAGFRY